MTQHEPTNTPAISGILSNWVFVTLINTADYKLDVKVEGDIQIVFGQILVDYKHRFSRYSWIHTSVVELFDRELATVTTMNSVYHLEGNGYEITADMSFYEIFKRTQLRPLGICETYPQLVHSKQAISGGSFLKRTIN